MKKPKNNQTICPSNKATTSKGEALLARLKEELQLAFSAPDSDYQLLSAEDIIQRNQPS